jgi:hypothetical protein
LATNAAIALLAAAMMYFVGVGPFLRITGCQKCCAITRSSRESAAKVVNVVRADIGGEPA